jgi:hypothetical protein
MAEPVEQSRVRLGWVIAGALALVPFVRMALVVRHASPLQYSDYWLLVDHFTNTDGSLRVAGLFEFEFQNHVVVLPMLVYWLNLQLFAGSNVALGVMVLLLGLGVLAMVGVVLRRSGLPPLDQMVLFVLSSCLLFTPNGAWNYGIAMSGTAWLGAGLIGIVAVFLRSRDRPILAFAASALAAITYATGLMVWPAVVAVGCCRREPRAWWKELPFVVGFVANYLWFRQVQTTGLGADLPYPNVVDGGRLLARLLAFPLGLAGGPAEVVGLALLAGTVALVLWAVARSRTATSAMWVGIAVFGLLATVSLAWGRYIFIVSFGGQNRYTSVPTVALIGLAGLVMTILHERGRRAALSGLAVGVIGIVALAATLTGGAHLDDMEHKVQEQELREIALHLGIADDNRYLAGFDTAVTGLLVEIDHQPFDGGWSRDCGLIDEPLDGSGADDPTGEITEARHLLLLSDAVELTGRVGDGAIDCIVVTGEGDTVLGAASLDADDGDTTFTAIARPGEDAYRVWAIAGEDESPVLVAEVDAADIEPAGPTEPEPIPADT